MENKINNLNSDNKAATPTLTLAKLYESQNQLIDALAVVDNVLEMGKSDLALEYRSQLIDKIYSDEKLNFSNEIKQIFSYEQLKELNILPEDKVEAYNAVRNMEMELAFPEELEIEEEAETKSLFDDIDSEEKITIPKVTESKVLKALKSINPDMKLSELSIGDLVNLLETISNEK